MKKTRFFYSKLAMMNLRKNSILYIPYLLTGSFMAATFYIMLFIVGNDGMRRVRGGSILGPILVLGTVVIGLFSIIILLYTNSFLMKRRKKEIGLFNILGMGKRHIAKMMIMEITIAGSVSIISGLTIGILLSKLIFALLMQMLDFPVAFGFDILPFALVTTGIVFGLIYFITLLYNLVVIRHAKPIELLYAGSTGEKEPKTKLLTAILGVIALGGGYYIAITEENPLRAIGLFFVAVILVIFGTYFLLTAGSIAALKMLKKNKKYYYKSKHFMNISGMLYRMKRNAVGLGNICILCTMVLVMLSGTSSLFIGLDDAIFNQYPRNVLVKMDDCDRDAAELIVDCAHNAVLSEGITPYNEGWFYYWQTTATRSGNQILYTDNEVFEGTDFVMCLIPLTSYQQFQDNSMIMKPDEILVYTKNGTCPYETLVFKEKEYKIKEKLTELNVIPNMIEQYTELYYIIFPDEESIQYLYENMQEGEQFHGFEATYGFDLPIDQKSQEQYVERIREQLSTLSFQGSHVERYYVSSAVEGRTEFLEMYGGLFFLGLFLGLIFIMATVLIMYYKQISEGFEDQKRFEIMQKVGMSVSEVKSTIRAQVLSVFFLPLIIACVHVAFAFKMITKLLLVIGLTNVPLFICCTIGTILLFSVIYTVVYLLTARSYYRIVK